MCARLPPRLNSMFLEIFSSLRRPLCGYTILKNFKKPIEFQPLYLNGTFFSVFSLYYASFRLQTNASLPNTMRASRYSQCTRALHCMNESMNHAYLGDASRSYVRHEERHGSFDLSRNPRKSMNFPRISHTNYIT